MSANSAAYYVADDEKTLSIEITLINQSEYLLTSPGFLGEGAELKAENVTLTYTASVNGNVVYAHYLSPYNVTVYLLAEFHYQSSDSWHGEFSGDDVYRG